MKELLILGSTGSIGANTLTVVREFSNLYKAKVLTVNSNIDELEKQINEFKPETVVVTSPARAEELKTRIGGEVEILCGIDGLTEVAKRGNYDIMVSALVGFAGLAPTIEGIKLGKRIALANKETLVAAGSLVTDLAKQFGAEIIPVDSEHSAIFQCLAGESHSEIAKIILTASGGPFFKREKHELEKVTVIEALKHPNWTMGSKITIDSATMMNKGLEIIEAKWLFNVPVEKIDVVIHPQSIIHSMVEFVDGSIKAQMSKPDMKLPIQYALTYPGRLASRFVETNFPKIHQISFFEPDPEKFDCLKIAYEAMEAGGTAPCIMNAANEIAVSKFLSGEIGFTEIPELIRKTLEKIETKQNPDIEIIFEADRLSREFALNLKKRRNK